MGTLALVLCLAPPASAATISFQNLPDNPSLNGEVNGTEFLAQGLSLTTSSLAFNVGCGTGVSCLGADATTVNDFRGTITGTFVLPSTSTAAKATGLSINFCCESNPGTTITTLYAPDGSVAATFNDTDVSYGGDVARFDVTFGFDAMYALSFNALTVLSTCGDGFPQAGEQCDLGTALNGSPGACCNADCTLRTASSICRSAAGPCDVAETCDGLSPLCPADQVKSAGGSFVCRPAAGACDEAETCDGASPQCPTDEFVPSTTVCRPAAGPCDIAESCTSSSAACPADQVKSAAGAFVCRPATGECDVPETCDGTGAVCPADGFIASGTPCADDSNFCTSDRCDGAGTCAHPYEPDPACPVPATGKGTLKVIAVAPPKSSQIQFNWKKGPLVQAADFGNPSIGSPFYELCLYEAGGSGVYRGQPLGPCGTQPCWKSNAAGWKFKSKTGGADGVTQMTLKGSSVLGKAQVLAKAKRLSLLAPGLQLQTPVIAQVRTSDGHCWGATFSTPTKNVPGLFKAKSD